MSLFILLHFLIFPYLYLFLLNQNPKSLLIDNEIKSQETKAALNNLTASYEPDIIQKNIKLIKFLLYSYDSNLRIHIDDFNSNNIIPVDTYLLYGIISSTGLPIDKITYIRTLCITNKHGKLLSKISEKSKTNTFPYQTSLREYLLTRSNELQKTYLSYNNQQKNIIEERELWTYKTILPYAMNIFSSDNIKPKSRAANIINFLHNFLVYFLLLAMIGSLLLNIITTKQQ